MRNIRIINKNAKYIRKGMFDWSDEEEKTFYINNIERIVNNLELIENADFYINKLKEKGNKIYIISGRDNVEYTNPYEMTVKWLEKYNIRTIIMDTPYNRDEKRNSKSS